jgi:hypothetical protein
VLTRKNRTSAAIWTIGTKLKDSQLVVGQFGRDLQNTLRQAVLRDLNRYGKITPQIRNAITASLEPMLEGMGKMVESMLATAHQANDPIWEVV